MLLNTNHLHIRNWRLPPWYLVAAFLPLLILSMYIGFFHWLLSAGLLFTAYWARPSREWPAWMLLSTLAVVLNALIISLQSNGDLTAGVLSNFKLFAIGNLLFAPLIMLGVWTLRRRNISMSGASGLKNMAHLHGAALFTAFLLMAKDIAYIATEGKVGDIVRGQVVNMQPIVWPTSAPMLAQFALSHFMGAFLGIMLVVPLAMWILVPANRRGSQAIMRSAIYFPSPFALALVFMIYIGSNTGLSAMMQILLLAAVVVFAFMYGWRGAVLSVSMVSFLIALSDHMNGDAANPVELQLFVAVMGAMALLFGASVDELKHNESNLQGQKLQLTQALSELADASRRNLQTEETERKRLARELHDDLGQMLAAMQAQLALAPASSQNAKELQQMTHKMSSSLQSVVGALSPDELNQLGLYTAITFGSPAQLCNLSRIDYEVELQGDGVLFEALDSVSSLAVYRIVQEAVTNAVKYAHCSHIHVRLRIGQRQSQIYLLLDIRDDGLGLKSLKQIPHGFHSIRDRALALNGVLHVQNLPGVRVHVLLRQKNQA